MSKTIASALCETNKLRGLPQENIFMQNLYRFPSDYASSFQRSAASTAPVQICALASAQADDTIGATALQEVMKILSAMTVQAQTRSVLDFESFLDHFLATANTAVCNLSISNQGAPVRVSITILFIEGDAMRIVSVGNTRAVLIRQGRVIPLTEDQTVAHRYVQVGAIPAEAENTHPERAVLTQFIGRFPQDGPIIPEKQYHMKLVDGDEICLLGTGIAQGLSDNIRDSVLIQTISTEQKAAEIIGRCIQNAVKGGLTVLLLRVESTLLMPAGAFRPGAGSSLAAAGASAAAVIPAAQTNAGSAAAPVIPDNPNNWAASVKRARTIAIIRPIGIFLGCILVGYLAVMLIFNVANIMKPASTPATDTNGSVAVLSKVMYVNAEMVALYSDASLNNDPVAFLNRGDVVTLQEISGSFSKVITIENVTGFVVSSMLSDSDPTIGEAQPEMSADPTPIPSKEQTAVTTSGPKETVPTETAATSSETAPTTSQTAAPIVTVSPTPTVPTTTTATPAPTTATATTTTTTTPTSSETAATTAGATETASTTPG
ncbi:MAG: hypothetical protein WCG21_00515 [Eubacteriales bacterium]